MSGTQPLWTPDAQRVEASNITRFRKQCAQRWSVDLPDYDALWQWSVDAPERFWDSFWDFAGIKAETKGARVIADGDKMPGAKFFPDAKFNFAENLLSRRDDSDCLVFWSEDKVKRRLSWNQVYDLVSRLRQALSSAGVGPGDRVAGFVPNMPETIVAMLATASLGAIWTSCSPDFGEQGVLDRFGQSEPKVLFTADGYFYNGKTIHSLPRVADFLPQLPSVEKVIVLPLLSDAPDCSAMPGAVSLTDAIAPFAAGDIDFPQLDFNTPLYIMYSSGTTGKPKCITHGAGGTLLTQWKEHLMHCDERPGDKVFYFTTCGWMMWNWLVAGMACGSTLMLYDGSPFYPNGNILFDYAQAEKWNVFGTSAKWIDACAKAGLKPKETHDLSSVRAILSTGSPLVPESFDYVYRDVKRDVQLSSISGGTDILGCFMLGNPVKPVWRGEIQSPGLGFAVQVFDDEGKPVQGEQGELVCVKPFPSMPLGFWGDDTGERYKAAYFEKYPNIWTHGDFIERTDHNGFVVYGRSDATLNPGGVRIGTAEIYRQVEAFPEVLESIVIGQTWDADTRVVLFVKMLPDHALTDDLIAAIKTRIRTNCTPRHVPAKVIAVADIPRTRSGKITELAVRDVVHGRAVKNAEALANPEALDLYKDLPELQD
ncbi:acetoacetate--CoA ligase [Rhodospirillaceae bacterium KN72]|uniref:Acetoacetate--CoA ligase n=1 Tax=Pacificispira spongiicola TaxID=2729598 RepID=A0A7Y0HHA9_9PROT|nr:acetoacetate--CoA ligase [Pacificispira spongiicola]NMM45294.1 acetoacetate--CoA ligase [Pacificispira spongiicola]